MPKTKNSPHKSTMSQSDSTKIDTVDVTMTDIADEDNEAGKALRRSGSSRPLPPTPIEYAEPQRMAKLKYADSKAAEKGMSDLTKERSVDHDKGLTEEERYWINVDNELKDLKRNYASLEKKHEMTLAQKLDIETGKKEAEENLELALTKLRDISEELQNCKDELFSLQPPNSVTDSHVIKEWGAVCSSIGFWIDNESGGIEDLRSQLKELSDNQKFTKRLNEYWGEDKQLIANHYSKNHYSKDNPIFDKLLLYNIHRLLEDRVFNDSVYLVGLYPSTAKLLRTIEETMAEMKPPRDPSSIGFWRSEALVALSSTTKHGELLKEDARKISQEAAEFLEPLLPRRASGAMAAFHRNIIMPAIRLANTMRQSTSDYRFLFRVSPNEYAERRPPLQRPGKFLPLYKADLGYVDVLDVGTGITLKKGKEYEEAKDASIAESILVVHPALSRKAKTGTIILKQQAVLGNCHKPPPRQGQSKDVESSRELLEDLFKFH